MDRRRADARARGDEHHYSFPKGHTVQQPGLFITDIEDDVDNEAVDLATQREFGQYFTPLYVADAIVRRHFADLDKNDLVLDPGCGAGAFLHAIPAHVPCVGVEIDPKYAAQARRDTGRRIIEGDFRTIELDFKPTAVVGNPNFAMDLIESYVERCGRLLSEGGRVGFILPSAAFSSPRKVVRWNNTWSLFVESIPRYIYPRLSMPIVFALFSKDRKRSMVGLALYHEVSSMSGVRAHFRRLMENGTRPAWKTVIEAALTELGGTGSLTQIYNVIENNVPVSTKFWRDTVRRTAGEAFHRIADGVFSLQPIAA